jgi:hypothetical protein
MTGKNGHLPAPGSSSVLPPARSLDRPRPLWMTSVSLTVDSQLRDDSIAVRAQSRQPGPPQPVPVTVALPVGLHLRRRGRNPYDRGLTDLFGELSARSNEFRTRWAAHNVRSHKTGTKKLHHPVVGDLDLTYKAMELPADSGLLAYTAEPGSGAQGSLNLLATWSATLDQLNEPEHRVGGPLAR